MKVGVSYNLFDGEELLEDSIKSIRNNVDYISVVYQTVSNFGNPCSPNLMPVLEELKEKNLIDELYKYKPDLSSGGTQNEIHKRNLGVALSENKECTHHMTMDTDEFYTSPQFSYMKEVIENGNYDSAVCRIATYYKEPIYRLPNESYYVSLLFKIKNHKRYIRDRGAVAPNGGTGTDPTRMMEPENCRTFERDEIEMHHMSWVRNDIGKKFNNSSSKHDTNEGSILFHNVDVNELIDYWEKWEYPQKALVAQAGTFNEGGVLYDVVKTENLFNIKTSLSE